MVTKITLKKNIYIYSSFAKEERQIYSYTVCLPISLNTHCLCKQAILKNHSYRSYLLANYFWSTYQTRKIHTHTQTQNISQLQGIGLEDLYDIFESVISKVWSMNPWGPQILSDNMLGQTLLIVILRHYLLSPTFFPIMTLTDGIKSAGE